MKGRAIVCLVLIVLFLVSAFSKSVSSGADETIDISKSSEAQSIVDGWPMFHHDLAHTGNSNSATPNTNQTLWKFNTGGQVDSPTVVDDVVYVGSYDHKIYALDAANGTLIWNYTTGGRVYSSPAVVIMSPSAAEYSLHASAAVD